jgi:hypothetical protein
VQPDLDVRVARQEIRQDRRQEMLADIGRCGDPDLAAGVVAERLGAALQLGHLVDDPGTALEIDPTGLGQADPPRRPIEQLHPEPGLELHDQSADRRGRHAQTARGRREAFARSDLGKDLHGLDVIHDIIPVIRIVF